MSKPRGYVIYRGPSLLDGAPIVAVALVKSRNAKTDNMVQTYIIRSDMDPRDANRTGADYAICGSCPHRGKAELLGTTAYPAKVDGLAPERSCYVVMGQGPLQVWKSLQAGKYPDALNHRAIAPLGAARMVRLGTYGDPAAVPEYVWLSLISEAKGHTAYSHQGDNPGADFNPQLMMRSADSLAEAAFAWGRGERTFRVLRKGEEPIAGREIDCPSSRGVACIACGLCGGASVKAKSITIPGHGAGAVHIH